MHLIVLVLTLKGPGVESAPLNIFLLYLSQLLLFLRWNFMTFFLQALRST